MPVTFVIGDKDIEPNACDYLFECFLLLCLYAPL